ncbi:hypothetical protein [Microbacterium lacticum]
MTVTSPANTPRVRAMTTRGASGSRVTSAVARRYRAATTRSLMTTKATKSRASPRAIAITPTFGMSTL